MAALIEIGKITKVDTFNKGPALIFDQPLPLNKVGALVCTAYQHYLSEQGVEAHAFHKPSSEPDCGYRSHSVYLHEFQNGKTAVLELIPKNRTRTEYVLYGANAVKDFWGVKGEEAEFAARIVVESKNELMMPYVGKDLDDLLF